MKLRIGVVGTGYFSDDFIRLFKMHPDVEEVALCDRVPERVAESGAKHGIKRLYTTYDEMLKDGKDLNCIAIFTHRHVHGPMVLQALRAGKNVYSAVPLANTLEEVEQIIEEVKRTGLIYMMGETCYYFPCAIYCREQYKKGAFGRFVYAESQYYHDIREMYDVFQHSGGDAWRKDAGLPPMHYSTHSISMALSALDQSAVKVSCMGFDDTNCADGIYGKGKNHWNNPFSNESALFTLSGGGVIRVNEFRRVGINKPSSYITAFYGDEGAYECSVTHHTFQRGACVGEPTLEDVGPLLNTIRYNEELNNGGLKDLANSVRYIEGFAPIQDRSRLPRAFRENPPFQHYNTHSFLVDDFVRAVVDGKLPPNNVWDAARYMVPGLIAHESAMRGGELMDIPDFGSAPDTWERLTYVKKDYYEE